jgi:hypothetical protein
MTTATQPPPDATTVESWNLDYTCAHYLLPRLRHLRDHTTRHPDGMDATEWANCLNGMIRGFEEVVADRGVETDEELVRRGVILFARFYRELWW